MKNIRMPFGTNLGRLLVFCIIGFSLLACEKVFDYSPYESKVKTEQNNTTQKNLNRLNALNFQGDTFSFAVIADIHYHYNGLEEVIRHINNDAEIKFVLSMGDVADQGLLKEFELFHELMEGLSKPYLTVIGNHDYLSNGSLIYQRMFGEFNYSFTFGKVKFVAFDNVLLEKDEAPDFNWLEAQLTDSINIVFTHHPPFAHPCKGQKEERAYHRILIENKVQLSMHGHAHGWYYGKPYGDEINYMITQWMKKPSYSKVRITGASHQLEQIEI